jgi:ABC-type polysaccharide/polyol phosphate transport system ATPase subunit
VSVLPEEAPVRVEDVTMEFLLVHERHLSFKESVIRVLRGERRRPERFRVLDGVSFRVAPGEALGIIGPNGSGKTTLLRLLAGVIVPTAGRVALAGRVTSLIDLGAGFNPELSGEENVFLAGAIYGIGRSEMRAKLPGIVQFAELDHFLHVPVKNYSSGMSARLGFAVATDVDPEILVVDEVLAVGDASFQRKCFARMQSFREAGKTIILVSHDLGTVASFCDRALLLRSGRIHAEGIPADVIAAYAGAANPA